MHARIPQELGKNTYTHTYVFTLHIGSKDFKEDVLCSTNEAIRASYLAISIFFNVSQRCLEFT